MSEIEGGRGDRFQGAGNEWIYRFGLFVLVLIASFGCTCGRKDASGGGPNSDTAQRAQQPMASDVVRSKEGPPSCANLPPTCGREGDEDCCASRFTAGGTYSRSYDGVDYLDPKYKATVSDFSFDRFEVTVGRFRRFVEEGRGTQSAPPSEGSGAHAKIVGSGWSSAWNGRLPEDTAALRAALVCMVHHSWTDAPGNQENYPINCLDWHLAFAFCAWDGGRLPTEAEWNYAASGGDQHRYYPWSTPPTSTTIDDSYAVYCGGTCSLKPVGSKSPRGDGRWGHADLGGNAWEWTLDSDPVVYEMPCVDCATLSPGRYRAFRSGSNDDLAPTLRSATRHVYYPELRGNIGARCARAP